MHLAHNHKVLEGLEFVFVELPKFKASGFSEKRLKALWLRYLSEIENATDTISPELMEVSEIREAVELLHESAYSSSEMLAYDKYWDSVSVERTLLADSYVEGLAAGKIEGKEEGIELMIINSYNAGLTIEIISNIAQRKPEQVKEILQKSGKLSKLYE